MALPYQRQLTNYVQYYISTAPTELLDSLLVQSRHQCESDFRLADEAYGDGQVTLTTTTGGKYWNHWEGYV